MKTKAQEDIYANLEMQIAMALDYNEWLSQEKQRTDALLDALRSSLRGLNNLLIQSQPEEVKVPEIGCEELPDGLKWKDAPNWATSLGYVKGHSKFWYNDKGYQYVDERFGIGYYPFNRNLTWKVDQVINLKTRPKGIRT